MDNYTRKEGHLGVADIKISKTLNKTYAHVQNCKSKQFVRAILRQLIVDSVFGFINLHLLKSRVHLVIDKASEGFRAN